MNMNTHTRSVSDAYMHFYQIQIKFPSNLKMTESNDHSTRISEEERSYGKNAFTEFNKKNYAECLKYLQKYETTVGLNWKSIHNKSVAEFYKNGFCNYEELEKVLNEITDGRALVLIEHFEINDADKCIAFHNLAVILYHLRQPFAALRILTEILKNIKQIDDTVVQKMGILTINILLDINRPKQAYNVLEIIQNRLGISKDTWVVEDDEDLEDDPNDKGRAEKQYDEFRKMFKFCFIWTNLLNGKTIIIPIDDSPEYAILKAHQYYLGNDFQMAAKELSKMTSHDPILVPNFGEDQNTCLANNMGLIHFAVRHYAMAVRFFQYALTFDQTSTENVSKKSPLPFIGKSRRADILYNLGVAMLHQQRPKEAFECLLIPLNYHHNNPKLWLRLAESCIMVHKQGVKSKESKDLVSSLIGTGVYRKYILQPTPHKYISDEGQSFAIPSPNLEFASLCLRNALTLVDYSHSQKLNNEKEAGWDHINEGYSCNPSKALNQFHFEKLRCAILAAYSYVLISLGEYTLALKHGKELLLLKYIPETYKMLGRLYCAESLIMMDRINEAIEFLEPKIITEENDFETSGSPDWHIHSLDAAQSVMTYNLAVAFLMRGDSEAARTAVNACKHPIVSTHLKMLKMYMSLLAGNTDKCRLDARLDAPKFL